jgi:hypothetical protein
MKEEQKNAELNAEINAEIAELTGVGMNSDNQDGEMKAGRIIDAAVVEKSTRRTTSKKKIDLPVGILGKIPRPGESIYIVDKYPVNDDEDASKESTICAYSLAPVLVMSSSLSEDLKKVFVNADIELSLVRKSSFRDDSREIFADEAEAYDRWKELMEASLKVAQENFEAAEYKRDFVKNAIKEDNY